MEVDADKVRELAESARKRGKDAHLEYQELDDQAHDCKDDRERELLSRKAASKLNDAFYWFGHANAYNGIVAMVELQTVVEDELDAEGSCP